MSPELIRHLFLANSVCAASLGLFMNIILIFLITKRTPSVMRPYARIMRIHCFSDILYDTVQFVTGLHPTPLGGHVFCLWQGFITKVPLLTNHFLFSMWYWTLLAAVGLLPIDFYYRYISVCYNKELSSRTIALMVFFAYFITWLHTFPNSYNFMEFGPSEETQAYVVELEKYEQWKGNVPSFAVTILGGSKALANYIYVLVLNIVSYSIIGYTSYHINQALKKNANVNRSAKTLELQKQVSRILVLQFVLPLVVASLPMSFIAVAGVTGYNMPRAGAYSSAMYFWLSAAKPAATIMIVRSYRDYIVRQICRPLLGRSAIKLPAKNISTVVNYNTTTDSSAGTHETY